MKIYAPNKNYTGVSATVAFVNGVGETEDSNLIEWFGNKGYEVEDAFDVKPKAKTNTSKNKAPKNPKKPPEDTEGISAPEGE